MAVEVFVLTAALVSVKFCVDVNTGGKTTYKGGEEIVVVASCQCRVGSIGQLGFDVAAPRSVRPLTGGRTTCKGGEEIVVVASCPCRVGSVG